MGHTNSTANYNLPQFVSTDKPGWLSDFNTAMYDIDTQMKLNETAASTMSILDVIHPVGSEYVTKTPTAPSIGTSSWTIVDKEYADAKITIDPSYITMPAGMTVGTVTANLSGHSIELKIPNLEVDSINDSDKTVITIDPAAIGATNWDRDTVNFTFFSDTGNVLISGYMWKTGEIHFNDAWVLSGTPSVGYTGTLSALELNLEVQSSFITDDTLCDRFTWERVS